MKEKLQRIRAIAEESINQHKKSILIQNQIIDVVDLALQNFEHDVTISRNKSGTITSRWTEIFDKKYDIQFKTDKKDKWHSFRWMINNGYNPPPLPEDNGDHLFFVDPEIGVEVRFVLGEWYEDRNEFVIDDIIVSEKFEGIEEIDEDTDTKLKHMVWGWWDSLMPDETLDDYPFANTVRTYANNVDYALSTEAKYVIPTLGLGKEIDDLTEHKIRQMLRYRGRHFINETRNRIPFVIIQDEPKWTQEQMELVIRLAEEEINSSLYYTYSFAGHHILQEEPLPQNAKLIHWNHYPFREETYPSGWGYVDSKEDFMKTFDMVVDLVKSNTSDDILMSLTTQTFAGKWRKDDRWEWHWTPPHPESPFWYAEAMSNHNFVGGLHYLLDADKEDVVAVDIPELMDNMKKVYEKIPTEYE